MAKLVSIVGSAGRKGEHKKMNRALYRLMKDKAIEVITGTFKLSLQEVHLVSGGAAWADHIAVDLFLLDEVPSLTLHLPADLEDLGSGPRFHDNGKLRNNPGKVANDLHQKFSNEIGDDSLKHLYSATQAGAVTSIHNGFHERNQFVAQSDYLVAFTWNSDDCPKKGSGTSKTWCMCTNGEKHHVDLNTLLGHGHAAKKQKINDYYSSVPKARQECSFPPTHSLSDDIEESSPSVSQSSVTSLDSGTEFLNTTSKLSTNPQSTVVDPTSVESRKRRRS